MQKSESIKNLAAALSAFQGKVTNPPKSADNPFFKSKYTPLDTLVDTAKPILKENGLSYIQSCDGDGLNISVTTLLMHSSGEWVEIGPLTLKADKQTAQGAGSAITYARRYSLAAALGLASDEDDDGNAASNNDKKGSNKPQSGASQQQGKPATSGLTPAQLSRLYAIANTAGKSADKVKAQVLKAYNVEVSAMTKKQYDDVCAAYEQAAAKKGDNNE
jgi:hypothetical protein